jgi:small subunit ribosomal protein S9
VTDVERPEDEPRPDKTQGAPSPAEPEAEAPPAQAPAEPVSEAPEEPAAPEEEPAAPAAEEEPAPVAAEEEPAPAAAEEEPAPVGAEEPASEEPATEEPSAPEQPVAEEPSAPERPGAEEPSASEQPAAAEEPAVPAQAAAEAPATEPAGEEEYEEIEVAPRQKPEIPGADLIPDIVQETEEFLDAEAQAAAEAEAEAAAACAAEEREEEVRPIADAAIDLAAGARYTATGKRKTSVARVILKPGSGTYSINGKPLDVYFPRETLRRVITQPLETVGYESRMDVVARMHGGGVAAQAGALRHGISRALIVADPHLRGELKRRGFLTRDPRVKERKKAGLKKARKRPQFSKR